MNENTLPDYPPPDKCKRPAEKFDLDRSNQLTLEKFSTFKLDAELVAVLNEISEDKIIGWLKAITGSQFKTRHTASPLNVKAAQWLKGEFQTIGYTDITFQDFKYQGLTRHNVIVRKPGKPDNNSIIIICAHYDSRMENLNDFSSTAPGGNDNASGIVTLLEVSRAIRQLETDCSILFICFSGEEQGLLGSKAFAQSAHDNGMDIRLVINLDMVGHPADSANPMIIIEIDKGNVSAVNDAPSRQFAIQMAGTAAAATSISTSFGPIYSSDYMPFEHFGYVCIGVYDGADGEAFYHTMNDTPEQVNTGFCVEIAKMLTAFVREAAKNI